jgi:hypothetical protein
MRLIEEDLPALVRRGHYRHQHSGIIVLPIIARVASQVRLLALFLPAFTSPVTFLTAVVALIVAGGTACATILAAITPLVASMVAAPAGSRHHHAIPL